MQNFTQYRLGKYSVRMTTGQASYWNMYGPFVQHDYGGAAIRLGDIWFPFMRVFRDSGLLEEIQLEEIVPLTSAPPAL
jgi:hypothetical protein